MCYFVHGIGVINWKLFCRDQMSNYVDISGNQGFTMEERQKYRMGKGEEERCDSLYVS